MAPRAVPDEDLTFWCLRGRPIHVTVNWDIPQPYNLDRYEIKSRHRLRSPRGYQHPCRPTPTNGRTFNYLFSLSYRETRCAHEPAAAAAAGRELASASFLSDTEATKRNRPARLGRHRFERNWKLAPEIGVTESNFNPIRNRKRDLPISPQYLLPRGIPV